MNTENINGSQPEKVPGTTSCVQETAAPTPPSPAVPVKPEPVNEMGYTPEQWHASMCEPYATPPSDDVEQLRAEPKPHHVNHGAYRTISVEEWRALGGDSNKLCDWHEGIGYVVYDEQAKEEYRASVERVNAARVKALEEKKERPPMNLNITKEWFEKRAALEGDLEIGAGSRKTMTLNLTPDEIAQLEKLLPRQAEIDQLRAALTAAEARERVLVEALEKIDKAARRYMLAVKRLGERSGYNRLTYFEAPISKMPTDEMAEEASARWIELNNSGQALTAALEQVKP